MPLILFRYFKLAKQLGQSTDIPYLMLLVVSLP